MTGADSKSIADRHRAACSRLAVAAGEVLTLSRLIAASRSRVYPPALRDLAAARADLTALIGLGDLRATRDEAKVADQ